MFTLRPVDHQKITSNTPRNTKGPRTKPTRGPYRRRGQHRDGLNSDTPKQTRDNVINYDKNKKKPAKVQSHWKWISKV